jgi:hypothetical protein
VNRQYGQQRLIHSTAVSIVITSLGSLVFLISAVAIRFGHSPHRVAEFDCYVTSYILGFVSIILEGIGLEYTVYGGAHISTQYSYSALLTISEITLTDTVIQSGPITTV